MKSDKSDGRAFYGTATVGEKGQVVIPSEARQAMGLKKGDKLLVFGKGCDMVVFAKLAQMERFANHLAKKLQSVRSVIKKVSRK